MLYKKFFVSDFKNLYEKDIKKYFAKKISNPMKFPKIIKVVINVGMGLKGENLSYVNDTFNEIYMITCQKPIIIKTNKSISNFRIKKGSNIGIKVTLRNNIMYNFINKFISISLPRINNFSGFSKSSFDLRGNFNFSLKDHNIFPEIFLNKKITNPKGFNVSIFIKNSNINDSIRLLKKMNFPIN